MRREELMKECKISACEKEEVFLRKKKIFFIVISLVTFFVTFTLGADAGDLDYDPDVGSSSIFSYSLSITDENGEQVTDISKLNNGSTIDVSIVLKRNDISEETYDDMWSLEIGFITYGMDCDETSMSTYTPKLTGSVKDWEYSGSQTVHFSYSNYGPAGGGKIKLIGVPTHKTENVVSFRSKVVDKSKLDMTFSPFIMQLTGTGTDVVYKPSEDLKIFLDPNGGTIDEGEDISGEYSIGDTISLPVPKYKNHIFTGWLEGDSLYKENYTVSEGQLGLITLVAAWEDDYIGGIDENGNSIGDGISDKYQREILLKLKNGKFSDDLTTERLIPVTLTDDYGICDENGAAVVMIPDIIDDPGYKQGAWDKPVDDGVITVDRAFEKRTTYSYCAEKGSEKVKDEAVYYKLIYMFDENKIDSVERHRSGSHIKLSHVPIRENYTFTGWYKDSDHTIPVSEIDLVENTKVYAGWELTDVPSYFESEAHNAYLIGYSGNLIKPESKITRAELAMVLYRLLKEDIRDRYEISINTFADVDEESWYNIAISTMANLGIVNGYEDGTFRPGKYVTRAEYAAMLARMDFSSSLLADEFIDTVGHWAEEYIRKAAAVGWIMGYDDGSFRPEETVSRAQTATMINRVLNRMPKRLENLTDGMRTFDDNSDINAWYYIPLQEASNSHEYYRINESTEKWTSVA